MTPGFIWAPLIAVSAATSAPAAETSAEQPRVAILAFAAQGVEPHVAKIVTQSATAAVDRLGVFRVISSDDIESMLSAEALKQMAGCSESSCLAEIAGAVGAEYIVSGSVGRLGDSFQISMVLIDQERAQAVDRIVRQDRVQASALPDIADRAARQVMRKLLEARQGTLELVVDEPGADIIIDGALVGVTPQAAALPLAQGPHLLEIAKSGFIQHRQEIEVRADQALGVSVRLTPSAEFREAYKTTNGTLRTLAWLSSGVAAVGAVAGLTAVLLNRQQQSEAEQLVRDNPDILGEDTSHPVALDANAAQVEDYQRLQAESLASAVTAYAALGAGAVAAVAAAVFWIIGEDPDRYDR